MKGSLFTHLLILTVSCIFLTTGCKKDPAEIVEQEVTFGVNHILPSHKNGLTNNLSCPLDEYGNILTPAVAEIVIKNAIGEETIFTPAVFFLNGGLYTQSIRMAPGDYMVASFSLRTSPNGQIIMATPATGSEYATYITLGKTVEFPLKVNALQKEFVAVEVLCWMPAFQEKFRYHHQTPSTNACNYNLRKPQPP